MARASTNVTRGCGQRSPGGVYAESGLSDHGMPLEYFLHDPPLPLPEGLDIVNKTQLWMRPGTEVFDLLIWVGAEHYPWVSDFIEEVRRFGASRKLSPNLQLSMLSRNSKMILAHPRARNMLWREQSAPAECGKHIIAHMTYPVENREGPCLFKAYELIPVTGGEPISSDGSMICLRQIGDTTYTYHPTGESSAGLAPGIFATLPLTGITLITDGEGKVNERAKLKVQETDVPLYESET